MSLEDRAVPAVISGLVFNDLDNNAAFNFGDTPVANQKVFLDNNNNGIYDAPTFLNSGAGSVGVVPDSDPLGIDLFVLTSGYTGPLTALKVNFDATMTWDSDIVATLTAPNGTSITLFSNVGGAGDNFTNTVFDDFAAVSITAGAAPFTGSFRPAPGTLATFNGLNGTDLNGTWTLHLQDVAGGDIMTVNSWSLDIGTGGDGQAVTDAAGMYTFSGLADGSYNVRTVVPSGFYLTTPASGVHNVTIAGADVTGRDFGQIEANTIQGRVFEDRNGNGIYDAGESGLAGRQVFLDTNNNGKFDTGVQMGPTLFASTDVPVAIPDGNATGITSKNTVAGTGTIVDIDVSVNISHTWVGDLTITIIAPGGQSVVLYQPSGDPDGDDMIVTFDDESVNGVIPNTPPNATPPAYNLDYQPQNKLSALDGLLADGEWSLKCSDSVGADSGTINSWSLNITYLPVVETGTVTGADGTYKFSGLAAGSYNVAEVTPAGWNRLAPAGSVTATVTAGKATTAFFTEARQNAIYGKTYFDANTSKSLDAGDTGLAGVKVYIDSNGNNAYDVTPAVNFVGGGVPDIVPDASTIGLDLTTSVSGLTGFLSDINVNFDASMTFDGDITAFLTSPNGVKITLFSQVGGGGDNFTGTTLDDQAAVAINTAVAPFSGSFKPAPGALSAFNGLTGTDLNGTWTLRLQDAFGGDTMTVNSWSLDIATGEKFAISDANGNYVFTGLPAGSYDIRRIEPTFFISNGDPVGDEYTAVVLAANATVLNRDFGHVPDPAPYVLSVTAANVTLPEGVTHTVTVTYKDDVNSQLIDFSKIDPGDIRILAPDNVTFLNPTKATATPASDNQTISVDYEFPALGGSWNVSDNGTYQIQLKANEVYDKDSPQLPVRPDTIGSFKVAVTPNQIRGTTYLDDNKNGKLDTGETPLANVVVYDDANNNGVYDAPTYESTNVPVDVLDNATAQSTLTIAGFVGTISDLNVQINISHTWDSDMNISLIAPDGLTKIDLSSGNGGAGDNYTDTTFDDQANTSITAGFSPFTGSFKPEVPLSTFNGVDPNGTWTLEVTDTVGGDTGTINGWKLVINSEFATTSDVNGEYLLTLADGTHNIRRVVPPLFVPSGDPVGNVFNITLNNDSTANRNFGHFVDPTPLATGSAVSIKTAGGTTQTITVVYFDPEGSKLIDYSSLGVDDIRVKAPDNSYLVPLSAKANPDPMGNAQTISVDYVIPAFGVDGKWDVTDDGTYSIEVLAGKVFDVDTPTPLSVLPATIGQFKVLIPRNLVVTNTNDSGTGSLRQAIIDSGTLESVDSITFAPGVTGKIDLLSTLPVVNDSVNIIGPGASKLTVSGGMTVQIMQIIGSGTMDVTISGLTFADGKANGTVNKDQGGAIYVGDDNLTLVDCVLTGNTSSANGGALYQGTFPYASGGNLTIIGTTFSGNSSSGAYQAGGGLASNSNGTITISRSSFINNSQTSDGGGGAIGLYNNPNLTIVGSTFSGNTAIKVNPYGFAYGGAILAGLSNPTITIQNSTFSGNVANSGGAISTLFANPGLTLNILNSTFTLNSATTAGGAINLDGTTEVLNITSSIIAQNINPASPDISGAVASATYNLIGATDGSTGITDPSNLTGTVATPLDAKLGALGLNGAPVGTPETHRPLAGSPAIDAGINTVPLTNDERGGKRTVDDPTVVNAVGGDGTDIGAVEIQTSPTVVVLTNGQASGQHSRVTSFVVTFDQPVTIANPSTAFTIFRTFGIGSDTTTGNVGYDVAGLDAMNQATSVTITFNDSGAIDPEFGSLRDGKYTVTVNGVGGVSGLDTAMTTNPVTNTWRLFGDGNGDGAVTAADFNSFRIFYGSTGDPLASLYDFDNNGSITASDFNQFRTRYGVSGMNMP